VTTEAREGQVLGQRGEARHRDAGRRTIADAVAALERLQDGLDESFDRAAEVLVGLPGKVITLGVGKSGHAAQKIASTLRSVGLPSLYLNASDSLHGDLGVVSDGDVALLISKSGATREVMAMVPHLRSRGVTLVAIVGTPDSPLARECEIALDASVEREGCPLDVAPMASILVAQALGDALAAAVTRARGFTVEDFAQLHPGGTLGARLTLLVNDVMRRGDELPLVAEEASLKEAIFEITRTGYGAVCVVAEDQRLVGFITDGDIRRELLDNDNLGSVGAADVMTRSPLTLSPELPLSQALLVLEQRKKAFLTAPVVVDGGRCVGLLRLHDAVQAHLPA
jgi:arabinose-5-phosphate isomerase